MVRNLFVLLALAALAAPFCHPGGCDSDAYHWNGIVSKTGDGGYCFTGKKRLCECVKPGTTACVPTLPPKTHKILWGLVTICNNGCSVYVCGVSGVPFYKKRSLTSGPISGRQYQRRRVPIENCNEYGASTDCQPYEPPPPPPEPTKEISSTPLSSDQVHVALGKVDSGTLTQALTSLGKETANKSQAELAEAAYQEFVAEKARLDLEHVDPAASLALFEQGNDAWAYSGGSVIAK
ncbi:MAG: hypothetical protein Q9213_006263 [Squamulea squamosa]